MQDIGAIEGELVLVLGPVVVDKLMRDRAGCHAGQRTTHQLAALRLADSLAGNLADPVERLRRVFRLVEKVGEIGGDASLTALQGMQPRDRTAAGAATRAVERIRMRRAL